MIRYSADIKAQRMDVVRAALDGGRLMLLGDGRRLIAAVQFRTPSGGVFSGLLHMAGAPFIAEAQADGELRSAILVRADGTTVADGLTVGTEDADITVDRTAVTKGNLIKIDNVDLRHA